MRILVVEDEATIATGIRDNLTSEGYDVDVVGDGIAAERGAKTGRYDLIVLDLMLPGQDGFAVCRSLRGTGIRTPIIMLTARAEEQDHVTGLELGADDYVTKPFRPRELRARVKALLRRSGDTRPCAGVHAIRGVTFDFDRIEVRRGCDLVPLTATEFKIVRALLGRRGRTVPIDELIEEVWGPGIHQSDGVIHTHMNNLRAKIDQGSDEPSFITTVRGIGYRFEG